MTQSIKLKVPQRWSLFLGSNGMKSRNIKAKVNMDFSQGSGRRGRGGRGQTTQLIELSNGDNV